MECNPIIEMKLTCVGLEIVKKVLMIGLGGGFDYYAENIKGRLNGYGGEWFYHLIQNPKRLLSRYFKTNIKFLWLIMRGNNSTL